MSKARKRPVRRPAAVPGAPARPIWSRVIFILALLGMLLTIHLWIQSARGFDRGCLGLSAPDPTAEVGCAVVTGSDAGAFFGVSNIAWGFLFYGFIAGLTLLRLFSPAVRAERLKQIGLIATGVAMLYVVWLLYQQAFVIQNWCVLCLISAAVTTALFVLHVLERKKGLPVFDTAGLVGEAGWYALGTFVVAALLLADVFFLNSIGLQEPGVNEEAVQTIVRQTVPQLVDPQYLSLDDTCRLPENAPTLASFDQFIEGNPLVVGDPNAPIKVLEVFSPNCPHCKTLYNNLQEAAPTVATRTVTYYVPLPLHPSLTPQSQAFFLAQEAGKLKEMIAAQFAKQKQGGLSIDELTAIAREIGMDANQFRADLLGGKYRQQVQQGVNRLSQAGITRVPQLFVNGRHLQLTPTMNNGQCLASAILSSATLSS